MGSIAQESTDFCQQRDVHQPAIRVREVSKILSCQPDKLAACRLGLPKIAVDNSKCASPGRYRRILGYQALHGGQQCLQAPLLTIQPEQLGRKVMDCSLRMRALSEVERLLGQMLSLGKLPFHQGSGCPD